MGLEGCRRARTPRDGERGWDKDRSCPEHPARDRLSTRLCLAQRRVLPKPGQVSGPGPLGLTPGHSPGWGPRRGAGEQGQNGPGGGQVAEHPGVTWVPRSVEMGDNPKGRAASTNHSPPPLGWVTWGSWGSLPPPPCTPPASCWVFYRAGPAHGELGVPRALGHPLPSPCGFLPGHSCSSPGPCTTRHGVGCRGHGPGVQGMRVRGIGCRGRGGTAQPPPPPTILVALLKHQTPGVYFGGALCRVAPTRALKTKKNKLLHRARGAEGRC